MGMVTVSECCVTRNGGGYVKGESEDCISCMTFTGKLMLMSERKLLQNSET